MICHVYVFIDVHCFKARINEMCFVDACSFLIYLFICLFVYLFVTSGYFCA
jgi:hypothetical protein